MTGDDRPHGGDARVIPLRGVGRPDRAVFAPIPLLSGVAFEDDRGSLHLVATVTVTLTAEDGAELVVPLTWRQGGWWAPPEAAATPSPGTE